MLAKFYMTLSISIRMVVGLLVFALLARGLGPKEFGFVALVFSYASLGSLVTDFGLGMKTLRDIAVAPENGRAILNATLKIKLILAIAVTVIGVLVVPLLPITPGAKLASVALTAGVMIASFGDLTLVALRARNRFGRESWVVGWTSVIYGAILLAILSLGGGIVVVSAGFLCSRILYAGVALREARRILPRNARPVVIHGFWTNLRSALSWAFLSNMSYINGQIDGIVIAPLLGLHDVGVYQSGAKFAGSAITFAAVITNTQMPRIANTVTSGRPALRQEILAWLQMLAVGASFGLSIDLAGPLITRLLIGRQYAEVNQLWLGFGCLTVLRFVCSAFMVSLVAHDRAKINLVGEMTAFAVTVPLLILLVPYYGLLSVPWLMCIGAASNAIVLVAGRCRLAMKMPATTRIPVAAI